MPAGGMPGSFMMMMMNGLAMTGEARLGECLHVHVCIARVMKYPWFCWQAAGLGSMDDVAMILYAGLG